MPRGLSLSLLSPELLVNILQSLSSARDLYTIIRASSQFYRIFATYKQSILTAVFLNAIPQNVELDFIVAHRAQRIWKFVPERPGDRSFRDNKECFDIVKQECSAILGQFESGEDERPRLYELISDDRALVRDMWEFYCDFEQLLIPYSVRALSNLRQLSSSSFSSSSSSSPNSESNELSFTEWTRLQRAFFRWEIYTCLFQFSQVCSLDIRFSAPSTDPAPKFAAMLRPWEVEEMCCVAQFYEVLMEELCDRIEGDFVTMTKEKMDAHVSDTEEGGTKPMQQKEKLDRSILEMNYLQWYSESFKRYDRLGHTDYLVSRGMLCMRKLTTKAPFATARKLIIESDREAHDKIAMMPWLGESNPREEREEEREEEEEEDEFVGRHRRPAAENDSDGITESLRRANFGWIWAMYWVGLNLPANYDLRNQGYVFWDKARLLMFDTFQSPRDPVVFEEFPSGYQEYCDLSGVETKLKDVPVYWKVIEEISLEIHGRQADGGDDDGDFSSAIDWRN